MSESEDFNRLVVLISKGGEMVVRKLLEKYSNPMTFSDYIYNNQATVLKSLTKNLYTSELDLVIQRNIDQMDVSLLCKLAFHLFQQNMTKDEAKYLKEIKEERNKLLHSDILKAAKIEESAFNTMFRDVSSLLSSAAKEVGNADFENEVKEFIERTRSSSSLFGAVYEELRKACISNNDDQIETLHNTMIEVIVKKTSMRPLTCMKDKFLTNFQHYTAGNIRATGQIDCALRCLEKVNFVTLCGRAGEGKTSVAFQLVKTLCERSSIKLERCVLLLDPKDVKHVNSSEVDLILVDDIFGKHIAANLTEWEKYFETLNSFVQTRKMKLITCTRKHIHTEYSDRLAGIRLFSKPFELNSADLTENEKRGILKAKLQEHSRDMNEDEIEKCIKENESNAAFPMIAAQFAADDELFSKRFCFFAEPVKYYLEQNLRNLDLHSLAALVCLMRNGNSLTSDQLRKLTGQKTTDSYLMRVARTLGIKDTHTVLAEEVWKRFKYLDGTFVRVCGDSITFLYDTVSNAVSQIWQANGSISFPVEEALEANESNLNDLERNNDRMARQSTSQSSTQGRVKTECCLVRFFKWLGRNIKRFWRWLRRKDKLTEINERGLQNVV